MNTLKNFTLLLATLFSSACDKDGNEMQCSEPGIIIGADIRACVCCGGWFIEIAGDTLRANLTKEFVESFDLEDLPIPVTLDWIHVENPCLGDEIEVSCIRK